MRNKKNTILTSIKGQKKFAFSPTEVAKLLKTTKTKVIRLIRAGELHAVDFHANENGKPARYSIAKQTLIEFVEKDKWKTSLMS